MANKYLLDNLTSELDKSKLITDYVRYFLDKTQSMFKYTNLPDTIPQKFLELLLQTRSNVGIIKVDDNLYAVNGGLGGEPNVYYIPTQYTVANPALKLSNTYTIDKDCVVVYNDSTNQGLLPLLNKYAILLAENIISMRMTIINERHTALISAPDDNTKASAEKYIADIINGKMSIVGENAFFDGVRVQPLSNVGISKVQDLIEIQQYLKASLYNELGLSANYNMKREAINSTEATLDNDSLYPFVLNMLDERKAGVERINKLFNTNIAVDFSDLWHNAKHGGEVEQVEKEENGGEENDKDSDAQ